MKKILRALIALLLVFVALCVGCYFLLDQNVIRQQVAQAVKQQTNLDLNLSRASFQLLPWPSFHAEEVSLARPNCKPFITANSVHADIAFLPLFHREIALKNFTVENGLASFVTHNDGSCSSWRTYFSGNKTDLALKKEESSPAHTPWHVSFDSFEIKELYLEWGGEEISSHPLNGRLSIEHLILRGLNTDSPQLDFKGTRGADIVTLNGRLGPVRDLFTPSTRPWVFSLGLSFGEKSRNDHLVADGVINDFRNGGKATITLQGTNGNLQDWKNLFPHAVLPDLRSVEGKISLKINDEASEPSFKLWGFKLAPTALSLHIGEIINVSKSQMPLAGIKDLHVTAEDAASALKIDGMWGSQPNSWHFIASTGTLSQMTALWNGDEGAVIPVDLQLRQSRKEQTIEKDNPTQFQINGQIGSEASHVTVKASGKELKLSDMGFLHSFWNQKMSAISLRDFTLQTDIAAGPLSEQRKFDSLSFDQLQLRSQTINGEGALAFSRLTKTVPHFSAHFHFANLDGTQFLPKFSGIKHQKENQKISKSSSFLESLKTFSRKWDGEANVTFDRFSLGELTYHTLSFYGLMGDGKLTIDPVSGQVDDIPMKARLSLDQNGDKAHLKLEAQSLQLPASFLLEMARQPDILDGNIQLDGRISAEGRTEKEFMRSLDGSLGLSLTEGRIRKSVLMPFVGPASTFLKMGKNSLKLRCFAGKMAFNSGRADIETMVIQAKHYALEGKGQINLPDQSIDMSLYPHIEFADNEVSTPLQVTGSIKEPRIVPARNENGTFQMNIGGDGRDDCAEAVQDARGGHGGPALKAEKHHDGKVGGILKSLGIGGKF